MPEELNSVEDIDSMLDQQFNISDDNNEEYNIEDTKEIDEESVEDSEEDTDKGIEDQSSEQEDVDNNGDSKKLSKDDKKEYAFAQMRRENSEMKSKVNSLSKSNEFLKSLAAQYGYENVEDFQAAYEKARIEKEANEKGYDPELYRQLQESNRRIAQLEEQNKQTLLKTKAENFKKAIDKTIVDYSLDESSREEIFKRLEEAGYTIDSLLSLEQPEYLIKGIMLDKIVNLSKQKQISKSKDLDDNLSDERLDSQGSEKTVSLDELIKNEMKEYKENYFL